MKSVAGRETVLQENHDSATAGQLGSRKKMARLADTILKSHALLCAQTLLDHYQGRPVFKVDRIGDTAYSDSRNLTEGI